MGVHGLTSVIYEDGRAIENDILHNSKVIIDAQSFICRFYFNGSYGDEYGGEYIQFANDLIKWIKNIEKCKITPIFVFDGVHESNKFMTTINRSSDKLMFMTKFVNSIGNCKVPDLLPVLINSICVQIFNLHEVKHVTCIREGDSVAAALSIHYNCPVLSSDSDFLMFPYESCDKKVITTILDNEPAKYNDCHECSDSDDQCYGMKCTYFMKSKSLIEDLRPELAPLFATLLGNDFVSQSLLNKKMFSKHCRVKSSNRDKQRRLRRSTILNTIEWISCANDLQSSIGQILERFKADKREKVLKEINKNILFYNPKVNEVCKMYVPIIESNVELESLILDASNYQDFLGHMPDNLIRSYLLRNFDVSLLEALFTHGFVVNTTVEDLYNCKSKCFASQIVRQTIYSVVYNTMKDFYNCSGVVEDVPNEFFVYEYIRKGCKKIDPMKIYLIKPPASDIDMYKFLCIPKLSFDCEPQLRIIVDCIMLLSFDEMYINTEILQSHVVFGVFAACFISFVMSYLWKKHELSSNSFVNSLLEFSASIKSNCPYNLRTVHAVSQFHDVFLHYSTLISVFSCVNVEHALRNHHLDILSLIPSSKFIYRMINYFQGISKSDFAKHCMESLISRAINKVKPDEHELQSIDDLFDKICNHFQSVESSVRKEKRRAVETHISSLKQATSSKRLKKHNKNEGATDAYIEKLMAENDLS